MEDFGSPTDTRGLTALVIGAGSGIGRAVATTFAARGGQVVVADLDGARATEVAEAINSDGASAVATALDVASDDISSIVPAVINARFGRLDALVNTSARVLPGPLETLPPKSWTSVFDVNTRGALNAALACLPYLKRSDCASIVHLGSLGGVIARPYGGAYGASKAALISLTRQMALEWAEFGIRANVVNPGTIDTPLARATVPADTLTDRASAVPMRRLGQPHEVAELAVFLTTRAAAYITAQSINVDGGHSQSLLFAPMGVDAPESRGGGPGQSA